MKMIKQLLICTFMLVMTISGQQAFSQGVTTAAMSGIVTDEKAEGIPGANIIAIHTPSGTQYGTVTRADGRFTMPGMRVGGPYTVTSSFVGFGEQKQEGIFLDLGQSFTINFNLKDANVQLSEVQITADRNAVISSERTGASTNISREKLQALPTINRSLADYTRLTPQNGGAGNSQSFGGRNGLYNNYTIDGAVFNNSFGLQPTIAGQANSQPISMDAIDQVQVSIAPYDVRQGSFTGASINAVTRSGTNDFNGSVYTFYRNQNMSGLNVGETKVLKQDYRTQQTGFRLGGPIIKNKLFFFINAEIERRVDPGTFLVANRPGVTAAPGAGSNTASVNATDLDALRSFLITKYGYDPGAYENYNLETYSNKATAKLDWNISQKHKFSIKYNYLKSYRDNPPSSSGAFAGGGSASFTAMPLQSNFYRINNNLHSIIAELNSTLGSKHSNNFTIGYIAMRDFRESQVNPMPFPTVQINNFSSFGYEPFSAGNKLNTNTFQISDNFTSYLGNHIVTVGTYNEVNSFENGFAPNFYGVYRFASVQDFYKSAVGESISSPTALTGAYFNQQYSASAGVDFPIAKFSAVQLGLFAQDEWSARKNVKLTLGLRVDMPILSKNLERNESVEQLTFRDGVKLDVSKFQKSTPLWSPRIGFNWDVFNNKSTQVRGGSGIFTGRIPYVWISNQAGNNGKLYGQTIYNYGAANATAINTHPFSDDVKKYLPSNATALSTYNLAATNPDFKFPQVWRTNIAIDQVLPGGIIGTLEGIYTKDVNAVYHQNVNLPNATKFAVPASEGGDNRPIYTNAPGAFDGTRINPTITDAIRMSNTNLGYSYSIAATLAKTFNKNFYISASYVYADSKDVNSGGSIAQSVWRDRLISGDPNANVASNSNYLVRHRFIASASYKKEYLNNFATSISLFYEAIPSGVFSYSYSGDMNNDATGGSGNDLIWVPRGKSDIILVSQTYTDKNGDKSTYSADAQWQDLDNYINQDKYLSQRRGQYAERNGATLPFQAKMDFRILQDFYINVGDKRNTLQLSLDILNLGNLLNKNWGVVQTTSRPNNFGNVGLLTSKGLNAQGQPTFSFDPTGSPTPTNGLTSYTPLVNSYNKDFSFNSRWQMQVGIRYIFGN
ncbi:MAG: TonB-dependent receptor [Bacteroidota bacterium]